MTELTEEEAKRQAARKQHNEAFLTRLQVRRPETIAEFAKLHRTISLQSATRAQIESADPSRSAAGLVSDLVLETIVCQERPVLLVRDDWINTVDATLIGPEAKALVEKLDAQRARFQPLMPLIGRIDVTHFPGTDFLGTAWFVAPDVVVTNRHVASLIARWEGRRFAFSRGIVGNPITASVSTAHEFDDLHPDKARSFAVEEVLYIEPDSGPHDIAFLRVRRRTDGSRPDRISIAAADVAADRPVFIVGYPARAPASVIPDQDLMTRLYLDRFDVKRAAPGYTMPARNGCTLHDCTTLGGNSGSVVLDLESGLAAGLHFAGLYQETNYAVRASVLTDYVERKCWNIPSIETQPRPPAGRSAPGTATPAIVPQATVNQTAAAVAGSKGPITLLVPLTLKLDVSLLDAGVPHISVAGGGVPDVDVPPAAPSAPSLMSRISLSAAEAAAKDFWDNRPDGVIAVRVGFEDYGAEIGDVPFIAASVPANQLSSVQHAGPSRFQTLQVRYLPANLAEQIEGFPTLESVDSIEYDDSARKGPGYSFDPVENETLSVLAHVGPEYSWEVLKKFLTDAQRSLVSAMYEFHGEDIADTLEERLKGGVSVDLVLDKTTFNKRKDPTIEFNRIPTFNRWEHAFPNHFQRIVVPQGSAGLISDSYHIKVTVREDDTFWLSSGNWKMDSSQPVITQSQRDHADTQDLPGNREWHVVIQSNTLAGRYRNHIQQDFERSRELGGGKVPKSQEAADLFVDIPIEEAVVLERRPPGRVIEPHTFTGRIKVKPLLTPDHQGAVYSEAVLELIRSARHSLLFQIPYIGMPANPRQSRGYIDELIKALTQKLKTLDDARLLLRIGGSKLSSPTHTAWYLKSKGVDIASRVRQIQNHHTKGMIVDGERILLGSHNWSKPGVTLNRDASLIFFNSDIAAYYAQAFEIDWDRANPIRPQRYVKPEGVMLEAVGDAPPPGYERVRLADLLSDED